jgi:GNAT superfamily N-acetyltransferase
MSVAIGPASETDLRAVLSILDEAAAFLQEIGVREQWPARISDEATWTQLLHELVAVQTVFVARQDGQPVGVFHLRESPELGGLNDHSWDDVPGPALYLYILAVTRGVAGKGVARAMLDWACSFAASSGRVLRLDCWAGNSRLKQYYGETDFRDLGEVEIYSSLDGRKYFVSRFERTCLS